jgi:hypothetical protein
MSVEVNTELLERAADMITMFEGKLIAQTLENDLGRQDFDALLAHTLEAEAMASRQEFYDNDTY